MAELNFTGIKLVDSDLGGKVDLLKNLSEKLKDAKDHPVRDRILAVLRSVITIGIVAATILGLAYGVPALGPLGPSAYVPFAFGMMSGGLILYSAMCFYNSYKAGTLDCMGEGTPGITVLIGPFLPIYEAFASIANTEKQVAALKKGIEKSISKHATVFKNDLAFIDTIVRKIHNVNSQLDIIQQNKLEVDSKNLENKFTIYKTALKEFQKSRKYYNFA